MTDNLQRLLFDTRRMDEAWYAEFGHILAADADDAKDRLKISIESRYAADPRAMDAYSRVACFLMRQGKLEKALEWFAMDAKDGRQTWWQKLRHAECVADTGRLSDALLMVERIYAGEPAAVNGFASIAWRLRKLGKLPSSYQFAKRDIEKGRLSPGFMLNVAELAMSEGYEEHGLKLVEEAYKLDGNLKDGYARAAWAAYGVLFENRIKALPFYEKDYAAERLSPSHMLTLAQLRAQNSVIDHAIPLIEQAYALNNTLKDGYARAAWAAYGTTVETRLKALPFYEKDYAAERLSPSHMLTLAQLRAQNGAIDNAIPVVEQAYGLNNNLKDGYARAGWAAYGTTVETRLKTLAFYEKDYAAKRLSPAQMLILAQLRTEAESLETALPLVEESYRLCDTLKDGLCKIAMTARRMGRIDEETAIELVSRDISQERSTPAMARYLSSLECEAERFDDAERHLTEAIRLGANPLGAWFDLIHARFKSSKRLPNDFWMKAPEILSRMKEDAEHGAPAIAIERGLRAYGNMMQLEGLLRVASDKTGMDIVAQWDAIAEKLEDPPEGNLPVLNARLYYARAMDLLVQFHEIVVMGSYCTADEESQCPFIIDGGTNIGVSLAYFKWLCPESTILAFEPNPHLFEICSRNIKENKWKNVTLLPYALAGCSGTFEFHCDEEMPMSSSLTSRANGEINRECKTVSIEARQLGGFIDRPVDFLKLDIEGSESDVIADLGSKLGMVRNGFIEYHYLNDDHGSNSLSKIIKALEENRHRYLIGEQPTILPPFGPRHRPITRWSCSVYFGHQLENK